LHIERQAANLLDDEQHWGDYARCVVGLQHAKKLASWYFDLPDEENSEFFFLESSACTEHWLPVVHQVRTQIPVSSIAEPEGSLLTPFELAPPALAVIGDNGLKEVQQGAC
jgi:hypothetical protein